MPYKYEKFEKLSDAVKAWENGETIWFRDCDHEAYSPKQSTDNKFYTDSMYYRRIKAKPFECWLVLDEFSNVKTWGSKKLEGLKPGQKTIWVREVIEG